MMNRNILHPMMFETPTPMWEWVYHSTELWLISLSVDGTTWYTIADKNLWASSLWWNWLYYQRWNNYWFGSWNYVWQQRVDATNYGPYYYSDTFIIPSQWWNDWTDPSNNNLWGGVTWTNESKRGPCPEWYHIPSKDENNALVSIMQNLWYIGSWDDYKRYLFMPYAGARESYNQWEPGSVNTSWEYWSVNSTSNSYEAHAFYISDSTVDPTGQRSKKTEWCCIRPFKNEFMVPDYDNPHSVWITIRPWIFWEPVQGFISVTQDWVTWVTIADKNLGATAVYSYWDELTESNCWKYFQRWNNYGFPFSWEINISSTKVNASNYWPYYYSSDFIGTTTNFTYNWSSVTNKNLWWWITNTDIAKRWPCPEWFHIPTMLEESEFEHNLWTLWGSIGTIYMPKTWLMYPNMAVYDKSFRWVWTSQRVEGGDTPYFRWNFYRSYWAWRWMQIRPFKNTPVVPDSTWTKLY